MIKKELWIVFLIMMIAGAALTADADTPPGPPGQPASMTLEAQETQELNGIYSTIIVATLNDADGQLSPGANTYFNTTLGSITTQYGYTEGKGYLNISDAGGKAAALLERSSLESATVTAVTGNGVTAALTILDQSAAANTAISISSAAVRIGQDVILPVIVSNANEIAGGSVKVLFDPAIVNVQSVAQGDFGGITKNIDNTSGFVFISNAGTAAVGINEAVLANITFRGTSEGITGLNLTDAELNMENGSLVSPSTVNGSIAVSSAIVFIEEHEATPGCNVTVPVKIEGASTFAGGSLTITFNNSIATVQSVSSADFGSPIVNINNLAGSVTISTAGTTAVGKENATFVNITFSASASIPSGSSTVLHLEDVEMNTEDGILITPITSDGLLTVTGVKGDLNRNGRRDTGDATLMLRTIVELPIPSQYQPVLPIGDMNCNSRMDTGDATLVLRDVVYLPIPRCWE